MRPYYGVSIPPRADFNLSSEYRDNMDNNVSIPPRADFNLTRKMRLCNPGAFQSLQGLILTSRFLK